MLCPDYRLLQDPGDGPKAEETPQDFMDSIGYKDAVALQEQMSMTTSEGTRSRKRQIDGMHSKQDGSKCNNNGAAKHLYTERYLGIFDKYIHAKTNP